MKWRVTEGTPDHAGEIARIHNAAVATWNFGSFLLERTDAAAITASMYDTRFLVALTSTGEIAGFLSFRTGFADKEGSPVAELLANLTWLEPVAEGLLCSPGHRHLETLAVHTDWRRCGVASGLYSHLFGEGQALLYTGFIVSKPFRNVASEAFHRTMGFRTVATYRHPYLAFSDFEANLLLRP